jgi:hypothetical protein
LAKAKHDNVILKNQSSTSDSLAASTALLNELDALADDIPPPPPDGRLFLVLINIRRGRSSSTTNGRFLCHLEAKGDCIFSHSKYIFAFVTEYY